MRSISRRSFLGTALASLNAMVFGLQPTFGNDHIRWDSLTEAISRMLRAQKNLGESDIRQLSHLLKQLDTHDPFLKEILSENTNDLKNEPDFTLAHFQRQFAIYVVGFQPGDSIPPHDHPGMSNATLCISGKVRVRSYEQQLTMDDTDEKQGQVTLQLVNDRIVNAHDVSTLTANRSNIHWLEASTECKLLDVFCPPYDRDLRKRVRYFDIDSQPVKGDLYRAIVRPNATSAT